MVNMDIEHWKKAYTGIKAADMKQEEFIAFVKSLRIQEGRDRRYLIFRKLLPVAVGVVIIIVLMGLFPSRLPLVSGGLILMGLGLLAALIFVMIEYVDISRENFDASVTEFLVSKEKRLKSWKRTPVKHHIAFGAFLSGYIMMNIGNSGAFSASTRSMFAAVIGICVLVMLLSWLIGEIHTRKRYNKYLAPLVLVIENLRKECQP
jgi:hypothetical protein